MDCKNTTVNTNEPINGYVIIAFVSLLLTGLSYYLEHKYPFIEFHETKSNKFMLYIIRFVHFYLFVYFCFYFLLFRYNDKNSYIYLFSALFTCITWNVLECCIVSYYELKMYGKNVKNMDTTFHPAMRSIFFEQTGNVMVATGVFTLFNYFHILLRNNSIYPSIKYLLGFVYILFFADSVIKSRSGKVQYYPKYYHDKEEEDTSSTPIKEKTKDKKEKTKDKKENNKKEKTKDKKEKTKKKKAEKV